jgi:hypothetical protein
MNNPMRLNYHQATFDLIEREPAFDVAAIAALDQCETAYGFSFPASVREWYSLKGSIEILREYGNQDNPLTLDEMQELANDRQSFHGWRDYLGLNVLPIMDENQSVALWAVHLDSSEDPPVLVLDDDEEWKPWARSFSEFVTGWVWHYLYKLQDCALLAYDQPLSPEDRAFLMSTFDAVRYDPQSPIYHFLHREGHLHIWARDEENSFWWLQAPSKEALLELTKLVWHCGNLAETLNIKGGYIHSCAGKVLEILRFGHELPEPDWMTRRRPNSGSP